MEIKYKSNLAAGIVSIILGSYMHNSCAASDRRRLFSNLWYHIKNDSLCNRRFMDRMWCGFADPEL